MTGKVGKLLRTLLYLGLIVLVGMGINAAGAILPFSKALNRLIIEAVAVGIICGSYFLFRIVWEKEAFQNLPLYPHKGTLAILLLGILIGAAMSSIVCAVNFFAAAIALQRTTLAPLPLIEQILITCLTMFLVAVWEETAIRGYLLPNVSELIGVHASCIGVAVIFGLLHLLSPLKSPQIVVSVFFASLMLNYAYFLSGSLYLPIGIHFSWNFLISVFSKTVYGIDYVNPLLAGTKGLEQGLVAISVSAIVALVVFQQYLKRNKRIA